MSIDGGYFRVARRIFEEFDTFWWGTRPVTPALAWFDLLASAAWKTTRVSSGRGAISLARGECIAPVKQLAARWNWSVGAVSEFLAALVERESLRVVRTEAATRVYAVVNYDQYQTDGEPSRVRATRTAATTSTEDAVTTVNLCEPSREPSREPSPNGVTASNGNGLRDRARVLCEPSREPSREPNREEVGKKREGRALSRADCDALWEAWRAAFGPIDYGRFRKAFALLFVGAGPHPTIDAVAAAITAYREIVEVEDPWVLRNPDPARFVAGSVTWLRLGAMPYTTETGEPTERMRRASATGRAA